VKNALFLSANISLTGTGREPRLQRAIRFGYFPLGMSDEELNAKIKELEAQLESRAPNVEIKYVNPENGYVSVTRRRAKTSLPGTQTNRAARHSSRDAYLEAASGRIAGSKF